MQGGCVDVMASFTPEGRLPECHHRGHGLLDDAVALLAIGLAHVGDNDKCGGKALHTPLEGDAPVRRGGEGRVKGGKGWGRGEGRAQSKVRSPNEQKGPFPPLPRLCPAARWTSPLTVVPFFFPTPFLLATPPPALT